MGDGEETASVLCAPGKAQGEPRALGAAGTTRKTRVSLLWKLPSAATG